ncbi:hypothetical protein H4S08_004807 [Coemansia sp. RSA 1365]|nr:hypothetical protein H4S08_004807 [Coemansia sp. RSA 1365]
MVPQGKAGDIPVQIGLASWKTTCLAFEGIAFKVLLGLPFLCHPFWQVVMWNGVHFYCLSNSQFVTEYAILAPILCLGAEPVMHFVRAEQDALEALVCAARVEERCQVIYSAWYKSLVSKVQLIAAQLLARLVVCSEARMEAGLGPLLTAECAVMLHVGNGNLNMAEEEEFHAALWTVPDVFAFDDLDMGLLHPEVVPPVQIPMMEHIA